MATTQRESVPTSGLRALDPPPLAPQPRPAAEDALLGHWFACYTRARHEKRSGGLLEERGFEVFLPLVPLERRWHDRSRVVEWPLFPSYLFVRAPLSQLGRVVDTHGIVGAIRFDGRPVRVPEGEIANVRRLASALAGTGQLPPAAPLLERGQRVRVVSGPFRDVEGIVVERRGVGRTVIQVGLEAIRQGLRLEVSSPSLRRVRRGRLVH